MVRTHRDELVRESGNVARKAKRLQDTGDALLQVQCAEVDTFDAPALHLPDHVHSELDTVVLNL